MTGDLFQGLAWLLLPGRQIQPRQRERRWLQHLAQVQRDLRNEKEKS